MVQYKLYYLDLPGRAEPLRMLFHYVGQEFEDVRISREDWPAQKSKFFYGQVPVLEVDGKQLGQSYAISQFLGKKFGLTGKDVWEEAKAAEINMYLNDFGNEMYPYLGITAGVMPGDPDKAREEIFLPGAAKHFPLVEKLLTESGSGFLLPSGLSYVDFSFASLLQGFTEVEPEVMAKYPKMVAFIDRVYGLPQLKAYFSKYPPKDLHNYEKA